MLDPVTAVPALLGGYIVVFGLISMVVKEWLFLSEALVATLFGIAIGPAVFNFVDPSAWGDSNKLTLEFARIVIAIQVMAAGINLPKAYLVKEWKSLTVLLLPVMFVMWIISALALYYFLPINFLEALLIGACVTPTDPVLANSIVKGRFAESHVPVHTRDIISAESGANDGLGFPYLFFALYLLREPTTGEAMEKWVYMVWGYQILLSIAIGAIVGYVARKLLYYSETREYIDKESFLVFSIALTLCLMACVKVIDSDDLLSVFIAGNSFTWDDWFRKATKEAHFQEVIDMMFNISFFVYFGTIIPWAAFETPGLNLSVIRLGMIALIVLVLRRLPIVVLMSRWVPAIKNYREAIFAGWFGPIGVGAIFYCMVGIEEMDKYNPNGYVRAIIFPVVSFLILASVIVHGVTVPLFHLTTIGTRSLTRSATIANFVSRLPIITLGQEIIIQRNSTSSTTYGATSTTRRNETIEQVAGSSSGTIDARPKSIRSIKSTRSTGSFVGRVLAVEEIDDSDLPSFRNKRKSIIVIEHDVDDELESEEEPLLVQNPSLPVTNILQSQENRHQLSNISVHIPAAPNSQT
ncbi:hypothetical protein K493DRAFT_263039 [Basidiobolus meristosporus CBS 931.73]|uniref:Cation/H+ exchanger transmembrane domain-containing protein n=1 Tax=Basidiobolus meristosporus CBS 931.73 TaxID=1314790 RepID=A0A1Y1Y4A9_9FUNG|nr:hypothetical protein K493DRAFT_263039 [Basidiobolus meristosporus CBS 931.73]|eukprot:ORX92850.1 hypothetical protein K493DRAFT_263039 [Basidiobolus meristosporus CBS 931.73]